MLVGMKLDNLKSNHVRPVSSLDLSDPSQLEEGSQGTIFQPLCVCKEGLLE